MNRRQPLARWWPAACALVLAAQVMAADDPASHIDRIIEDANASQQVVTAPIIDDLALLRRMSVDLIGRIPTDEEIRQYEAWPAAERRARLIDRLIADDRFADRWTVFFADMLRIRSNATGGTALLAYVHRSVREGKPYDEMARELISANGKANREPAVGYVLGDEADPMALAGATAQIFLGVRIQCAQCHDHPFDDWKQEQFYGLAAYFGKTRRVETQFARSVYTTESDETVVLWPPERQKPASRHAVEPAFPIKLADAQGAPTPDHIARLIARRAELAKARVAAEKQADPTAAVDSLLESVDPAAAARGKSEFDVVGDAKQQVRKIDVNKDLYRPSDLRRELAQLVTDPRNRYFSRALVNRVWAELVGHGFVEPLDDFSAYNKPTHDEALNVLADEFVAGGYDLRSLVRLIVSTTAYQRGHLDASVAASVREASYRQFAAAPVRRMISEVLYDSIVTAGHLEDYKWPEGANVKVLHERVRVALGPVEGEADTAAPSTPAAGNKMASPNMMAARARTGYDLESSIEVNFDEVLRQSDEDEPGIEMMRRMSKEEIEAMRMQQEQRNPRMRYTYETIERRIDDNPKFGSSMRMATPASPDHFLRIFGQPARDQLGEFREQYASMRQELLMLNGKLTHEASRVGPFEPMHVLLTGAKADVAAAIRLAYREILTREPTEAELTEAKAIVGQGDDALEGMADLRWALLNTHEFRYLP